MVVFGEPVGSASWTGAGMCVHICTDEGERACVYTHWRIPHVDWDSPGLEGLVFPAGGGVGEELAGAEGFM